MEGRQSQACSLLVNRQEAVGFYGPPDLRALDAVGRWKRGNLQVPIQVPAHLCPRSDRRRPEERV